jgi:hypothetical protein
MATYTVPTNVTNGDLLDNTKFQTLIDSINYLYDGTQTGGIDANGNKVIPMYVVATSAVTSIVNTTSTNVVFNTFIIGSNWWNGTQIDTSPYTTSSLTGKKFIVYFQTNWGANTTGFRQSNITISTTNCTVDFSTYRTTRTPPATGTANSGTTAFISFVDTGVNPVFDMTFSVWQNSGGALNANSFLRIYQIPTT